MLVETINTVPTTAATPAPSASTGEVNLTTSAIARMNLFLHDIEDFKIVRGDTLRKPGLRELGRQDQPSTWCLPIRRSR